MYKLTTLILLPFLLSFTFVNPQDCGDGNIYSRSKQTANYDSFDGFHKISSLPKMKGGNRRLLKIIRKNLRLSDVAKTQIFSLNYQFTITCDGQIKDIKALGDIKVKDWTNIVDIIVSTEGKWRPAKKHRKPVDCIYFDRMFINGGNY
jgi:hypothetical protein